MSLYFLLTFLLMRSSVLVSTYNPHTSTFFMTFSLRNSDDPCMVFFTQTLEYYYLFIVIVLKSRKIIFHAILVNTIFRPQRIILRAWDHDIWIPRGILVLDKILAFFAREIRASSYLALTIGWHFLLGLVAYPLDMASIVWYFF